MFPIRAIIDIVSLQSGLPVCHVWKSPSQKFMYSRLMPTYLQHSLYMFLIRLFLLVEMGTIWSLRSDFVLPLRLCQHKAAF